MKLLSAAQIGSVLFMMKSELEVMVATVKRWRSEGINGTGMVPLEVISIEPKLNRLMGEVESLIRLVSKLEAQPSHNLRESSPPHREE